MGAHLILPYQQTADWRTAHLPHLGPSGWNSRPAGETVCVHLNPRHACISYDGFKDLYKLYMDGVKVDSGPFSGDDPIAPVR